MEIYIIMVIIGIAVLMISCYSLGKSNGEAPHLFKENAEIEELEEEINRLREQKEYYQKRMNYLLNFREAEKEVDEDF